MPPLVSHATLYSGAPKDSRIWLYGGTTLWWNTEFPGFEWPTTDIYSLWSYDTAIERWDQYDIRPESLMRPSYGLAAEAPELGLGFYFNGQIDSGSSQQTQALTSYPKIFLEGMIMVNTTDQIALNISTDAAVGGLPRTRGGAAYIPRIAGSGILAIMGGTYKPSASLDGQEMTSFANMDNITIFDVGAYLRNKSEQLWYSQNATGEIPEPRAYFCTVLVSALDSSSHNIYLYSGQGPNNHVYDDVYVLSIPSFTWTKVFNGSSPRFGHTCHKVGTQMITVGGKEKVDPEQQLPCDWEEAGIGIFNMSDLQWGSQFMPEDQAGPYAVPKEVQERIMDGEGKAPLVRSAAGWTDRGLGRVFDDPEAGPKKLSAGAISGIVIGSIAGAALVMTGGWFAWKWWSSGVQKKLYRGDGQTGDWQPPDRGGGQPMQQQTNGSVATT